VASIPVCVCACVCVRCACVRCACVRCACVRCACVRVCVVRVCVCHGVCVRVCVGGGAGNKDKARAVSFLRLGHTRDHMPTQIANNALSPPTRNTRKQRSEPTNNELERWNMVHLPPLVMSLSG